MESGQGGASIGARALAAAERFSDAEAIVDGRVRISYAQLGQEVVRSTRAAMGSGIKPGDRVSIWAPNGHRWIIAALGVLGAGGVLVPLSTRFKGGEAAYVLGKAGACALFTDTLITGDCAHHAVRLAEPHCCSLADADPDMATATRQRLVREHADTGVLIVGSHFPPPGAGYLVTTDGGVRFQPAAA